MIGWIRRVLMVVLLSNVLFLGCSVIENRKKIEIGLDDFANESMEKGIDPFIET